MVFSWQFRNCRAKDKELGRKASPSASSLVPTSKTTDTYK